MDNKFCQECKLKPEVSSAGFCDPCLTKKRELAERIAFDLSFETRERRKVIKSASWIEILVAKFKMNA